MGRVDSDSTERPMVVIRVYRSKRLTLKMLAQVGKGFLSRLVA